MKDYLDSHQDVSKEVNFSIKEKDRGERRRLTKIFHLRGLDAETEALLQTNAARWESRPDDFWKSPSQSVASPPPPQVAANIVGGYILARRDDA